MSSECKLGIIEPHDYQCTFIDSMIIDSKEAIKFQTQAVVAMEKQTIIQANKESLRRIERFPDKLEDFRTAIEDVREWGNQWKNLAELLLEKYEPEKLNPPPVIDPDIPF